MTEICFDIEFIPVTTDWKDALAPIEKLESHCFTSLIPDEIWGLLEQSDSDDFEEFEELSEDRTSPVITNAEFQDQKIILTMQSGYEAEDQATLLLQILHDVGCHSCEAIIYNGGEVTDYLNEVHMTGTCYYFNEDNEMESCDHPIIEYQYYD